VHFQAPINGAGTSIMPHSRPARRSRRIRSSRAARTSIPRHPHLARITTRHRDTCPGGAYGNGARPHMWQVAEVGCRGRTERISSVRCRRRSGSGCGTGCCLPSVDREDPQGPSFGAVRTGSIKAATERLRSAKHPFHRASFGTPRPSQDRQSAYNSHALARTLRHS
jgi:hypothetical protein